MKTSLPNEQVVTKEKAMLSDGMAVCDEARDEAKWNRAEWQLHVAHPHWDVGALEDLLKVNASKARAEASTDGGHQAERPVLFKVRRFGLINLRQLHQHHAKNQHQQRRPLDWAQRTAEDQHGKKGCG